MKNTMNNKKIILKITALVLIMQMLILSGCTPRLSSKSLSSKYKSAVDFADYWLGSAEEIDSYPIKTDSGEVIIHNMKDKEYGFEYVIEQRDGDYYSCKEFHYQYLKTFLEKTDMDDLTDKYDLRIELADLQRGKDHSEFVYFSPLIKIYTDRLLTDEEHESILQDMIGKLAEFDSTRQVFRKENDSMCVSFQLFSAPWDTDPGNPVYHSMWRIYGDDIS